MRPVKKLRDLLAGPGAGVAPGVYDALTAFLVERAGFQCVYLSGASVSFTRLGRLDLGLTTLTEVDDTVARICERIELPLVVDADTGYGNALNVQRTVALLERMGASGIQLEDQQSPKRCGHLAGKNLVAVDEMTGKIRAALDARVDEETVIVARSDALAVEGIDKAIARGHAYVEAGADVLFIEAPRTVEHLQQIGREFANKVPLLANMVEGGRTPLLSANELGDLGFSLVIFPGAMLRVHVKAAAEYLAVLKADGTTSRFLDRMLLFDEVNGLIGLDEMIRDGQSYAGDIRDAKEDPQF